MAREGQPTLQRAESATEAQHEGRWGVRTANVTLNFEAWRKMPVLMLPAARTRGISLGTRILCGGPPTGVNGQRHDALVAVALRVLTREHDRGLCKSIVTQIRPASASWAGWQMVGQFWREQGSTQRDPP